MSASKVRVNLVMLGHAGVGKTALVAELVRHAGCADDKAAVKKTLAAEAAAGNCGTVDVMRYKFETPRLALTAIDTPGRPKYLKNMITGIAQADAAVVVVAGSPPGAFESEWDGGGGRASTRDRITLAHTLGVKRLVVCVSKFDNCGFGAEKRFNTVRAKVREFLNKKHFFKKATFLPVSAQISAATSTAGGGNVATRVSGGEMDWFYNSKQQHVGLTLLEALDTLKPPKWHAEDALRIPVSRVLTVDGMGTIAIGRVESGVLRPRDAITFAPTGKVAQASKLAECVNIEMHNQRMEKAGPGDFVGFSVKGLGPKDIRSGDVCGLSKDRPPRGCRRFLAQIVVLDVERAVAPGVTPVLDCHVAHAPCRFNSLLAEVDPRTGQPTELRPESVRGGHACLAVLTPANDRLCVEPFTEQPALGRFALRDNCRLLGVGIVLKVQYVGDGPEPTGQGHAGSKSKKNKNQVGANAKKQKAGAKAGGPLHFSQEDDEAWADVGGGVEGGARGRSGGAAAVDKAAAAEPVP